MLLSDEDIYGRAGVRYAKSGFYYAPKTFLLDKKNVFIFLLKLTIRLPYVYIKLKSLASIVWLTNPVQINQLMVWLTDVARWSKPA